MPTVETKSDPYPSITLTTSDEALESEVTVAPAGTLRVIVLNRGDESHGVTITRADHPVPVAHILEIEAGGQGDALVELIPGEYHATMDDSPESLDFTVQAAENYTAKAS